MKSQSFFIGYSLQNIIFGMQFSKNFQEKTILINIFFLSAMHSILSTKMSNKQYYAEVVAFIYFEYAINDNL